MNFIAKLAVPAALALAAFGAQAEGFTPSAGGVYTGPVAQVSAPNVAVDTQAMPYTPIAGGVFKGPAPSATTASPAAVDRMSVSRQQSQFLGA